MTSDRELQREFDKDKARLADLNRQYTKHEEVLLENLYKTKRESEKISDEKKQSFEKWKVLIKSAANTSTLPEPAEFKAIDNRGKRRSIKIGPKTSSHEVRKAIDMHDASKYDERKKREIANWRHNQEQFVARMSELLKKKNRILGFSSSDDYFDSYFENPAGNPHTIPANVVYHTSFRQPSPDKRLEIENARLLEELDVIRRQFQELTDKNRSLECERNKLLMENTAVTESLNSNQERLRQIAENRDEHAQATRRYAEDNKRLENELQLAQAQQKGNTAAHRVTFDDTNEDLREEVKTLSTSLAKMKSNREPHDILRDIGVATRLEFLQTSKAHEYSIINHHSHHRIISRGFSGLHIDLGAPGTPACLSQRGNIRADAALLAINTTHRLRFEQAFQEIYGVPVDDVTRGCAHKFAARCKFTELANLRGTMAHVGCFTQHTPDADAEDEFLTLAEYCESEYQQAVRRTASALLAAKAFSSDAEVIEACNTMRGICEAVVEKSKSDRRNPLMSGGLGGRYI